MEVVIDPFFINIGDQCQIGYSIIIGPLEKENISSATVKIIHNMNK